jgi:hypothetical protein
LGANDIPTSLRQLATQDILMQKKAFGNLSDNLTPWEVFDGLYAEKLLSLVKREETYLIIPFLIEILENKAAKGKNFACDLLHDIAWYIDLEQYVTENEKQQYEYYAKRLYDSVSQGIDIYRELANSPNAEVSQAATNLLEILARRPAK